MAITLSQNEIAARAAKFAEDWKNTEREKADAQPFLIDFFHVLGVSRKRVAIFEHKVKCGDGGSGYIDLFWKGHILVEMKSRGKDLGKAYEQAKRYADSLAHHEFPQVILVCDFENWHFYDLRKDGRLTTFSLSELPQHISLFHFLAGYGQHEYQEEDPVNVQAAELLGKLHDGLKAIGYTGHPLEVYLVRLLFCLFAEDTGIFCKDAFRDFIQDLTSEDGNDLAARLAELFQVLNTPEQQRFSARNDIIKEFPYVNGGLFAEFLPMPAFDSGMRRVLLDCCAMDWGRISPAIFGSMFQSVMKAEERRALGAHYTSERHILKLINPLFMDALREEFEGIQYDKSNRKESRLRAFHQKLASLTFLDPACGCGNFLVVAYRELRRLELEVIREFHDGQRVLDVTELCKVNVDQFYGIEIEEFPAQIAQVAMWLMDHQMNIEVGNLFGQYFARIPLTASASIVRGNALQLDWESVVPKEKLSYIMGNPPFVGYTYQTKEQKADIMQVMGDIKGSGKLDFVACWYFKAAKYIQGTKIRAAYVSTNSITQGEQVALLWKPLLTQDGLHINFAYPTFKWENEARGNAGVHCVIIGFSADNNPNDIIIYSSFGNGKKVRNINGYLAEAPNIFIGNRSKPLSNVPEIMKGNQPTDNGLFMFWENELDSFLSNEPQAKKYIKKIIGSREYINNITRYCLWLKGANISELRAMPHVMQRISAIREYRLKSTKVATRKCAETPTLFQEIRQPEKGNYIALPEVSSERRNYIPMSFLGADVICTNKLYIIPGASLFHFGVLTSTMHMAWMRVVTGRLKSDFQYSAKVVYNNFPWPEEATEEQQKKIAELAQGVLDARVLFPDCTLADLYDPLTMPPELVAAHRKLDAAVEKAYGRKFVDDAERVAFLFGRHSELTSRG